MNFKIKKILLNLIKIIPYLIIIFILSACINGNPPDIDEFIIQFAVEYNPNGADGGMPPLDNNDYISGDIVTVPGNPHGLKKENYSFTGWNLYPDGNGLNFTQGDLFAIGGSDVVLFARWSQNPTFSVTYNSNNAETGIIPEDTTMYEEGMHPIVADNSGNLVKSGYNFIGWSANPDSTATDYIPGDLFEMGASNVILYAVWSERPTYVITYMANGAESGTIPPDNNRYETGQIATVSANVGNLRKSEYGFAGWNTEIDGSGTDYKPGDTITIGTEDIRLYVKWVKAYSVTYDRNNADSGSAPVDPAYYPKDASVTVAGPGSLSREGYNFAGWNTQIDGSGTTYAPGEIFTMGESNIILYVQWTAKPVHTITYDKNGAGGGTPPDSSTYFEGARVTAKANTGGLVKTGYSFLGWNTQTDGFGTTYIPGEIFTMGYSDVILYAKWGGPGMLDITFNNSGTGTDGDVYGIAIQSDGKIIIAGNFTKYNGITRNKIARLHPDGSLDFTFDPGDSIGTDEELIIAAVAIRNDEKIVIVGNFTSYNGIPRNRIAVLDSTGDLDATFDPGTGASGEEDAITCVAIQSDGKIIAGGSFSTFNDEPISNIVRLSNTGEIDKYFAADYIPDEPKEPEEPDVPVTYSFPDDAVSSIAIQSNGKIVIGGVFNQCGSHSYNKLARFNSDGTFDTTFTSSIGVVDEVYSIAIQSEDKILVSGSGGYFVRCNSDGTLDTGFPYSIRADEDIYSIVLQPDGKILLCGAFESFSSTPCKYLIRLNSNGTVDTDFKTDNGADNTVTCMAVQDDGNILIGGAFTMYEGAGKCGIVRVLK
ncbi:MAG: InlB B-repeat-containing protein [Leptospirales bacterium]|nr:InlB B-repeat-containing protein [Leptospirales bacterium]